MEKIKVGLITPDSGDACSVYRGFGPYMRLDVDLSVYDGKRGFWLWEAVMKSDIVVVQRPHSAQTASICETVKAAGKPLIVDWDDDLTSLPPWNPHLKAFAGSEPHLKRVASLADVVTVTGDTLAAKATELGAKAVKIVPNAMDDSFRALPRLPRTKRAVWRGSNTHSADQELCKPVLQRLAREGYEILFFGALPPWAHEIRHRHFDVADYSNYITLLNSAAPEYLVCHLVDCAFNRAKSDVAAQEAYLVGAKILHNGVGAFAGLPEVGEPRWLSETNQIRMELLKELTKKE